MKRLLGVLLTGAIVCAAEVPQEGLKAEMSGQWAQAAAIYETLLKTDPSRIDLYLRLGDIYAKEKQLNNAAQAIERAIAIHPSADLYARLASIYATANRPDDAQKAIDRALTYDPDKTDLLIRQAEVATWRGDYPHAVTYYRRLIEKTGNDTLLLPLARNLSWSGRLSEASLLFERYTARYPHDKEAVLDAVKNAIWQGDYPHAEAMLDRYTRTFGNDPAAVQAQAELYTRAEWPDRAGALLTPLLRDRPQKYTLGYLATLLAHYDHRPTEALDGLTALRAQRPDAKDTDDLRKIITTPLRSSLTGSGYFFRDADGIGRSTLSLYGRAVLSPTTVLFAGGETDRLSSKKESPYRNIDGSAGSTVDHGGLGLSRRASSRLGYTLAAGYVRSDHDSTPYVRASADLDLSDKTTLMLDASRDTFLISPRSASLGIKRTHTGALVEYRPDLAWTVLAQAEYDALSHGNTRWSALIAPRRAVIRNEYINLDIGVKGWWFGYDKNLDDGYYDPKLFESYMATFYSTFKFSADDELSLIGGAGMIKDDQMSSYRPGYNIDALATVGIYRDWQFQLRAGYMNNQRQIWSSSYDAYYGGITITRRF